MVSLVPLLLLMVLAATIATSAATNVVETDEAQSGTLTSDSPREYNWPDGTTVECTGPNTTTNEEVMLISSNTTYKTVRRSSGLHGWINLETSELVLRRNKKRHGFENLFLTEGANINLESGSRLFAPQSSSNRDLVELREWSGLHLSNSVMHSQDRSHFYVGKHGMASFGGVVVEMSKSSWLDLVSRSIDWTCGNRRERYVGEKCTFIVGDNRILAIQYSSTGSQLRGRGYSLKLEPRAGKAELNEDFYLATSTLVLGTPYYDRDSQDFFYVAENVLMHFETSVVTILDGISLFAISPKGNGGDHEFKILESILELRKDTVDETSSRYCGILPTAGTLEGKRAKLSIEQDVKTYLDFFVCGSDLSEVLESPYLSGSEERQKRRVREYAESLRNVSMKLLAENKAEFQKLVAKMEPCSEKSHAWRPRVTIISSIILLLLPGN